MNRSIKKEREGERKGLRTNQNEDGKRLKGIMGVENEAVVLRWLILKKGIVVDSVVNLWYKLCKKKSDL